MKEQTQDQCANSKAAIAQPFIERIESIDEDLASLQGTYMAQCKARREDKKTIYGEAKDKGLATRALKGVVKARRLQRKIDAIDDDFDIDESAAYRDLSEGLGPLGQAAAVRAGYGSVEGEEDSKDLRPGFMKQKQKERDHGDLSKVGRGPVEQNPVDAIG